ncbi:MAG: hydantoinase/oxoprolinase family protein [Nitrospinae bacterium]|nr:hydantoinase/oxoprolinase family protein [Nitrospinota bacterium]
MQKLLMTQERRAVHTIWIGIDTGGTFTDLVLVDLTTGAYHYHKRPTTTDDPAQGILDGLAAILDQAGMRSEEVRFLVLGTTIATNAVLESKTARTGMLTTRGFRDILELARQRRPHLFNLDVQKPQPPAPRDCRFEVTERIANDGTIVTPLNEDEVRQAIAWLRGKGVEAVTICFLHAYTNPTHEHRAKALVHELWPDVYVCTSSDVLAEFREFERFATATVNASLMPIMDRYLERFEQGVHDLGIRSAPRVMQSNGGAVTPGTVRRLPVNTFFSGPAGGVIGSRGLGAHVGLTDLITFDMGGTSTDVCLIRDGEPAQKTLRQVGGFPVRTRTIDIHTIGAGGGSIAWVDAGGLLKVGPMSAGAEPGPAAYGRGGTRPTVTDANIVLGRLNPHGLLGGRMAIYSNNARGAIENALSRRLTLDIIEAAAGILAIVNANMMGAVRVISVEQGEDPRNFTLVAFGGAGPLHAADVARTLGMRHVLVPPHPGLLSAIGLLHADVRGDFSLTRLVRAQPSSLPLLNDGFAALRRRGEAWLAGEQMDNAPVTRAWLLDMRYVGQNSELSIAVHSDYLDEEAPARLMASFHQRHKDAYGYDMPDQPIEIVTLRLMVTVALPTLPQARVARAGTVEQALLEHRQVWFPEAKFVPTPIYARERLPVDAELAGPCIVEQMDTTTVVPPKATLRVDALGYLHMDVHAYRVKG